jgi:ribonuclease HII
MSDPKKTRPEKTRPKKAYPESLQLTQREAKGAQSTGGQPTGIQNTGGEKKENQPKNAQNKEGQSPRSSLTKSPTTRHELALKAEGLGARVVGVDEVGYGAWAGPITTAGVWLNLDCLDPDFEGFLTSLRDSKALSASQRQAIFSQFMARPQWGAYTVQHVGVEQINALNSQPPAMSLFDWQNQPCQTKAADAPGPETPDGHAPYSDVPYRDGQSFKKTVLSLTLEAMSQAAQALGASSVLVDGRNRLPTGLAQKTLVGGDAQSASIALASILAKVTRDNLMQDLHAAQVTCGPSYGWDQNKGYGTQGHQKALLEFGPGPHHRMQYCRRLLLKSCA